jgi:hypothetical protein
MDHRDLDIYLRAKLQHKRATVISIFALVVAAGAGALLIFGVTGPLVKGVLLGSIVGAVVVNNEFGLFSAVVTKRALLQVIENQINRDPDAIAYLARKA